MRGDFSRIRFNPAKQYSMVLEQQGRVALDADANERSAIDAYTRDTTNIDVIGPYGGPVGDAGFGIEVIAATKKISIKPGRYYVEGLLVEIRSSVDYDSQPFLIDPTYTSEQLLEAVVKDKGKTSACLTLEVWQRLVTWLDDPCLVEPALGQADTTARLQTVWRVVGDLQKSPFTHLLSTPSSPSEGSTPVPPGPSPSSGSSGALDYRLFEHIASTEDPVYKLSDCCQSAYDNPIVLSRSGAMGADTGQGNNECGCQPIPSAGFQGLENQLYRVEIHTGGKLQTATFKWSRENGSVVTQVLNISGQVVTVSTLGPDANLGFQAGQWVEFTDDTYLFGEPANRPGQLYQIQSIGPGPLQLTFQTTVSGIDTNRNARMRRWDQFGSGATADGVALSTSATQLENGIEVAFKDGDYQPGDYWTIPARAADGSIDWDPCGGGFFQPAKFTKVYSAPLACIRLRAEHTTSQSGVAFGPYIVDDCRLKFPPLSAVNIDEAPPALHVQSISWANDDVITIDAMLQNGLSVTFDQTPTCPWGGGNFQVSIEVPFAADPLVGLEGKVQGFPQPGKYPAGTDVFIRTVMALDPPLGIQTSGKKVSWIAPEAVGGVGVYETYYLYATLNTLLKATAPLGFARMRIRLLGEGVYGDGANGNIYLDGLSFGETSARVADGSPSVGLPMPSGSSLKAADFESWFYLAPSIIIVNAQIQLMNGQNAVSGNAVTVAGSAGNVSMSVTGSNPAVPVTSISAIITMSYAAVAATTLSPTLVDTGGGTAVGTIVTVQGSVPVNAGSTTVSVPITILGNPGMSSQGKPNVSTVGLNVSVPGLFSALPYGGTQPTLVITGTEGTIRVHEIPSPFPVNLPEKFNPTSGGGGD